MKLLKDSVNVVTINYDLSVTVINHMKDLEIYRVSDFFNFQDQKIIKVKNLMNCSSALVM